MLPLDTLLTFVGAATLLSWAPGPDNLFVLTQSALGGRAVGVFVTLGLCTGLIVHTIAVALGVAAIFQTSQFAFDALKIIGAGYLVYIAYKSFRAKPQELRTAGSTDVNMMNMYMRGIVMNVTNPKVAIFFLAFLPQFTSPDSGNMAVQMMMLGGIFILCAFVSFILISVLAGALSDWLRRSQRGQLWLNRLAGVVFIGLAFRLATSQR